MEIEYKRMYLCWIVVRFLKQGNLPTTGDSNKQGLRLKFRQNYNYMFETK